MCRVYRPGRPYGRSPLAVLDMEEGPSPTQLLLKMIKENKKLKETIKKLKAKLEAKKQHSCTLTDRKQGGH